ncbi:LysR family transcriptional regulator [Luteibacter sp. CQ10]|uniref:LysR family transcriptional regulator n=1 Tax=Luteibacter sp. CQ10 TaxID=2805821 RepID=UPI0034A5C978
MRHDHFDGLIAFVTVAEEGGFSAAAVKLGVTPSAVSQTIRNLERRLGLVLFNRTTRSVRLTETGARYLARVKPALDQLSEASQDLGEEADRPVGMLRINIPRAAYLIVLQPVLRRFMDAYPEIFLEIRVDNFLVDIVSQGFDAGIRFGELVEKDMCAVMVGPLLSAQVLASPQYLEQYGTPSHPRDLLEHNCIGYRHVTTGQVERWAFSRGSEHFDLIVKGRMVVNDSEILLRSALDGLGIIYTINGYTERFVAQGKLVRLVADWSPDFPALHLYYPDRRRVPAKLRALIDFLLSERDIAAQVNDFIL